MYNTYNNQDFNGRQHDEFLGALIAGIKTVGGKIKDKRDQNMYLQQERQALIQEALQKKADATKKKQIFLYGGIGLALLVIIFIFINQKKS